MKIMRLTAKILFASVICVQSSTMIAQTAPTPYSPPSSALQALSNYNVTTFGELIAESTIQGKSLVAGDVAGAGSSFGSAISGGDTAYGLVVNGDILGGSKTIENGSNLHLVGEAIALINFNGGGQLVRGNSVELEELNDQALELSDRLATLAESGSIAVPSASSQPGPAYLNASPGPSGLAVINVPNGALLFGNTLVQQIEVNTNGASAVVINVGGSSISFDQGNFVGITTADATSSRLLWNFYEAQNLDFHRAFEGSVLAPNAQLINRADIDGAVIARSLEARASVGLPLFQGAEAVANALSIDGLGYPAEINLVIGDPVNLIPESSGMLPGYSISPGLPPGLELNTTTGEISGLAVPSMEDGVYAISAGDIEQTVSLVVRNSVAPLDIFPAAGSLVVEGLNPFVPNPTTADVTYALEGSKYDNVANDIQISVNGTVVDPQQLTLTEDQIRGILQLSSGRNEVDFKFYDEVGRPVYDSRVIYAGNNALAINFVSEDGNLLAGELVTVTVRLADDPTVVSQVETLNGSLIVDHLPPRTVLIEARTQTNLLGAVGAFVPDAVATVTLRSFSAPSTIDNNDISLGLEGWEFSAGAASVVPHDEGTFSGLQSAAFEDMSHSGNTENSQSGKEITSIRSSEKPDEPHTRAHNYEAFKSAEALSKVGENFATLASSDNDIRLVTVGEGPQRLSRTFQAPAGTASVRIRYRFITSEIPGGYFGTQYNDTFSVSLRSQNQGGIKSESGSMNSLGLISFDSTGRTTWREVELQIGEQGDVIQADVIVANVADGQYDSAVEIDFIAVEQTPVRPSLSWDATGGGLDLSYVVTGEESLTDPVDIELFWANGTAQANTLGESFFSYRVASGTNPGNYGPEDVFGNFLGQAPDTTTHIVAVAGNSTSAIADVAVAFGANADQATVTQTMMDIVKDATRMAGAATTTITSTARTPEDQARAMFQNLSRGNDIAANIADQLQLYAAPGDQVVLAFQAAAAGFTPAEIRGAEQPRIRQTMLDEINNQGCERVSRHCADPDQLTVIDVGRSPYSTTGRTRFVNDAQPRVDRLLNEDRNNAFHLELSNDQNP